MSKLKIPLPLRPPIPAQVWSETDIDNFCYSVLKNLQDILLKLNEMMKLISVIDSQGKEIYKKNYQSILNNLCENLAICYEIYPEQAYTLYEWEERTGKVFPLLKKYLIATDKLTSNWDCPYGSGWREIINFNRDDKEYAARCTCEEPNSCDPVFLSKEEITLYRLCFDELLNNGGH